MTSEREVHAPQLSSALRASPRDEKLWLAFFKQIYPAVYYTAYRITGGDPASAQDIVQEAFLRFIKYRGFERVDSDQTALAYLRQTARHLAFDQRRQSARLVALDDESIDAVVPASEPIEDESLRIDLRRLLGELSPDDQEVIALSLEGFSTQDIAKRLDLTYSAAATRLQRARKRLEAWDPAGTQGE